MKKVLVIMNPYAGVRKAFKAMGDIVEVFNSYEYMTTVLLTKKRGDGTEYVKEYAKDFDVLVAVGGDGTFNEVVEGMVASDIHMPLGYIPAGSTNDFAQSMGLSENIVRAAENIALGDVEKIDVGRFNGRCFTYVASFGAFTKSSYDTPQNIKNLLGHLAYILSGINSIHSIKSIDLKVTVDGKDTYEGEYIFGAISNSTSMGGVLKLEPDTVDMGDGRLEMLLVKTPKNVLELAEIGRVILEQDYENSDKFVFIDGQNFEIEISDEVDWSLDGEYQKGMEKIQIEALHHAISLLKK